MPVDSVAGLGSPHGYSVDRECGAPLPLGAWFSGDGVIALFSRHANKVELLLFESPEDAEPAVTIPLDPTQHRTGDIWRVWVADVPAGQCYPTESTARISQRHRWAG